METIQERFAGVHHRIEEAARRSGRSMTDIRLVAVSKNHPAEAVSELFAVGQRVFGENRVQEAKSKIPLAPGACEWHLIGHLQKNKIRQALPLFQLIHSVDSVELAAQIHRVAEEDGMCPAILIEVNISGEASKFGFKPDEVKPALEALLNLKRLEIRGLMGMAPFVTEAEHARPHFAALRDLRDQIQDKWQIGLPELSMGMSGDFEVAIEEGSTLVRVGTSIFGA